MVFHLPLGLEISEQAIFTFLIVLGIGAYLNFNWARIAKKYMRLEQQYYHPLLRKYEHLSGNVLSFFVEPKPLPFFDYVFRPQHRSFAKKILWWARSLFLLGMIAMDWWIVIILLLITRQVPSKKYELLSYGLYYKKYDNAFLLDALAYHLAYISAVSLLMKMNTLEVIFSRLPSSLQNTPLTANLLYTILIIWGALYIIADILTILISIYDYRRWRSFWVDKFAEFPKLVEDFQEYYRQIKLHKFYPVDKKYILGCLINIALTTSILIA